MWNRIKSWFGTKNETSAAADGGAEYEFKWYDPGPDNPFPIRILDVRSLTWKVVATTSDMKIAESFSAQRQTDGREFVEAEIENSKTIECNLVFPHNGDPLQGVVYKADSMDVKWDIYIYDSVFHLVRSWTGQLQYRAAAHVSSDKILIYKIEASVENADFAPQAVYFLLATHAMGRVLPHTIPLANVDDPETIALFSFSMYGNLACYATFDDITKLPLSMPHG